MVYSPKSGAKNRLAPPPHLQKKNVTNFFIRNVIKLKVLFGSEKSENEGIFNYKFRKLRNQRTLLNLCKTNAR